MEVLDVVAQGIFHAPELLDDAAVIVGERVRMGNNPVKVLVREHDHTVHKVAIDGHKLAVVALLEVLPGEIVILGLGSVGREHVAQHILLAGELFQVVVKPDSPVARGRDFLAFQVEELVGGHVIGQLVTALGHEHGRENQAVEHDIVLANEVNDAGVAVFPVRFPVVGKAFLGVANVANGRIEPHVEHLALDTLDGHRNPPVEVASHRTGLQVLVEPRLALPVHVGLPLLVLLQDPLAQGGFPLVERHVPVLGGLEHRHMAGDGALGVDEVGRVEACAARLALVAIGVVKAAMGACARHIAIGQELARFLVIELF